MESVEGQMNVYTFNFNIDKVVFNFSYILLIYLITFKSILFKHSTFSLESEQTSEL